MFASARKLSRPLLSRVTALSAPRAAHNQQARGIILMPHLPYDISKGVAPAFSAKALDFHINTVQKRLVDNANELVRGTKFEGLGLYQAILDSSIDVTDSSILNNLCEHWNHCFLWRCIRPGGSGTIPEALEARIVERFGSVEAMKLLIAKNAIQMFGSGWVWLVENADGQLEIVSTREGRNPLLDKKLPLLALDVCEHAYIQDFGGKKAEYVEAFFKVVDWDFVAQSLQTVAQTDDILVQVAKNKIKL